MKLAGVLAPNREPPLDADPIAEALEELRAERRSRLTVTEGILRGLPLITRDPLIRDCGLVQTLWE